MLDQVVEVGMQGREHFEARTSLVELCLLPLLVEAGDKVKVETIRDMEDQPLMSQQVQPPWGGGGQKNGSNGNDWNYPPPPPPGSNGGRPSPPWAGGPPAGYIGPSPPPTSGAKGLQGGINGRNSEADMAR